MSKRGSKATWAMVEKGLPIPEPETHGRNGLYPLSIMNVGDSFFSTEPRSKIYNAIRYYISTKAGKGAEFTMRNEGEGIRCWRIT